MYRYETTKWTSTLIIYSDVEVTEDDIDMLFVDLEAGLTTTEVDGRFRVSGISSTNRQLIWNLTSAAPDILDKFVKHDYKKTHQCDYTGLYKGYAIATIKELLVGKRAKKFYINFGGDILSSGLNLVVGVGDEKHLKLNLSGDFCCFTSDNKKRPGHINHTDTSWDSVTVIVRNHDAILADVYATATFGGSWDTLGVDFKGITVIPTRKGYPVNVVDRVYIASPWFNEKEVRIKKNMMKNLIPENLFDPNETENSKAYDVSPGTELAKAISKDNISSITACSWLFYPKNTEDLGTIFDMSYGLAKNKTIFAYDEVTDSFTMVDNKLAVKELPKVTKDPTVVRIASRSDAVILGYYFAKGYRNLMYETSLNDNIMLSINFKRVKKLPNGNSFEVFIPEQKEIR